MWIPAGLIYVIAGLAMLVGWLRESELRVQKQERASVAVPTLARELNP